MRAGAISGEMGTRPNRIRFERPAAGAELSPVSRMNREAAAAPWNENAHVALLNPITWSSTMQLPDRHTHAASQSVFEAPDEPVRANAHATIDPAILYFGTPVALISTLNADGSANLAPMSSLWWLGRSCLLGFGALSHTPHNLRRTGECVINLPSVHEVSAVNRLARTTGSDPVPPHKQAMGYRHEPDKFREAGLSACESDLVAAPRVRECPVHLEARVVQEIALALDDPQRAGHLLAFEMRVVRVHVHDTLRLAGHVDRIDPDAWRPLIMTFTQFYGLGPRVHHSTLSEIPESAYRPRSGMTPALR